MSVLIYTAPLRYRGDDRLDVTRTGNDPVGRVFAPSSALLLPFKALQRAGLASRSAWQEYARRYRTEMLASRRDHPDVWADVLARREVTFCCFEVDGPCHRHLLAALLRETDGAVYEGERDE